MSRTLKLSGILLIVASTGLAACNDERPGRHRPPHGDRWDNDREHRGDRDRWEGRRDRDRWEDRRDRRR